MAISYPVNMPLPLVSGYNNTDAKKIDVVTVVKGAPRFELVSDAGNAVFNCTWLFTPLQMKVFDGWFKHDLNLGEMSFDMSLKVGSGLMSHEFTFIKNYKSVTRGRKWKVTASLITNAKRYDDLSTYEGARDELILNGGGGAGGGVFVPPDNGISSFTESVNALSPVNWFRFTEVQADPKRIIDHGSRATDLIQNNDLSLIQTNSSSNYTGSGQKAIELDDDLEFILESAPNNNYSLPNVSTIEFAWKPSSGVFTSQILGVTDDVNEFAILWHLYREQGLFEPPTLAIFGNNNPIGTRVQLCDDLTPFVDQWNYVSISIDKTGSNTVNCKINDVLQSDASLGVLVFGQPSNSQFFMMGGNGNRTSGYDEFQLYDKLLTDSERTRNYRYWLGGSEFLGFGTDIEATQNPLDNDGLELGVDSTPNSFTLSPDRYHAFKLPDLAGFQATGSFELLTNTSGQTVDMFIRRDDTPSDPFLLAGSNLGMDSQGSNNIFNPVITTSPDPVNYWLVVKNSGIADNTISVSLSVDDGQ